MDWGWLTEFLRDYVADGIEQNGELDEVDLMNLDDLACVTWNGYKFETGAEKLVLVPLDKSKDYVIKIVVEPGIQDYKEPELYQKAKKSRLDEYFAECWDAGYCDIPLYGNCLVYFQRKVGYDDEAGKTLKKSYKTTQSARDLSNETGFNIAYVNALEQCYGVEKATQICQFLRDNGCSDFHSSNWRSFGGKVIAIDYCGYEWDSETESW